MVTIFAMVSVVFRTLGCIFGLLGGYAIWLDISSDKASLVLGQFWFEHHAPSLQVSEAIISRYIDPCGLIVAFGCEPFLWHPLIATTLGWPAALNMMVLMLVMFGFARLFGGKPQGRASSKSLKRSGSK